MRKKYSILEIVDEKGKDVFYEKICETKTLNTNKSIKKLKTNTEKNL